jgi:hypothetical protein
MAATYRTVVSTTDGDASAEGSTTGINDGDIMIAFLNHSSSSATISSTPSDTWDLVEADPNPADFSLLCYKRVKQAGDSATPTWTWSAAGNWTVDIIAYSGQDTTTPLDDTSSNIVVSDNVITTTSVTPAVTDCVLVWFASVDATGPARTWTQSGTPIERLDRLDNAHHRCIAEEVIPTSGSGITRTATVTDSAQAIGAFAVLVRPATGAAATRKFQRASVLGV